MIINGIFVWYYVLHTSYCFFTQNYLTSEGIEVNPPEGVPSDPYIERRIKVSHGKGITLSLLAPGNCTQL